MIIDIDDPKIIRQAILCSCGHFVEVCYFGSLKTFLIQKVDVKHAIMEL